VGLNGAISSALTRPAAMAGTTASWPVTLTARFPTAPSRRATSISTTTIRPIAGGERRFLGDRQRDVRFGAEDVVVGIGRPKTGGKVKLGTDVAVDAPPAQSAR